MNVRRFVCNHASGMVAEHCDFCSKDMKGGHPYLALQTHAAPKDVLYLKMCVECCVIAGTVPDQEYFTGPCS
jgi:hypothetical protein